MPIQAGQPNGGEVLDEIGVPVVAEFPKRLTEEVVQATDLVITMGCGDACPTGRRYMEWSVAAPWDNPWRTSATSGGRYRLSPESLGHKMDITLA